MNILEEIVQKKKEALDRARTQVLEATLQAQATDRVIYYDFESIIARNQDDPIKIIAEIKQASPSRGVICRNFDLTGIGSAYQEAGVDAISVLTEEDYFKGDLKFIDQLRQADIKLPILRKDFIFDSYQVIESAAAGADALLFIVAILEQTRLAELCEEAASLHLLPVVEVFNESELETALGLKRGAIQINNRNLKDFTVDLTNTERLMKLVPADFRRPVISASGFFNRDDAVRAEKAGSDAILVGESLMRQPDNAAITNHVRELRGA